MKKILILLAVLGAFAHGREKVAVYISGKNQTSEQSKIIEFGLTDAINASKSFILTERQEDFLNAIKKENLLNESGDVDEEQIADIGKNISGARYICVAVLTNLSEAFSGSKESLLTARLIDVESAAIAASAYRVATITDDKSMLSFSENLAKALLWSFEGKDKNAKKEPAAIYLASGDSSSISKVLRSLLIDAVANSKEYAAKERTKAFLGKLSQELELHESGDVDDKQLSKFGKLDGVKYVVVLKTVSKIVNIRKTVSKIVNIRVIDVSGDAVLVPGKSKSGEVNILNMRNVEYGINELTKEMFIRDIAFGSVSYMGQTYKTVEMPDGKEWFAENLNYEVGNSKCYENKDENCKKYGRLYDWKTAKQVCPSGWHLPSWEEWDALSNAVGETQTAEIPKVVEILNGYTKAGWALKSKSGWNYNGTDEFGFSALPGGFGHWDGSFGLAGMFGSWWSANKYDKFYAFEHSFPLLVLTGAPYSDYLSVRCLQGNPPPPPPPSPVSGGVLTDSRDGKKYKVVKIGEQTWMAENLNYDASGSKCYGEGGQVIIGYDKDDKKVIEKTLSSSEVQANCQKYGRLYNYWQATDEACPSGWHLPSKSEYEALDKAVGGEEVAEKKLKAIIWWKWDDYEGKSGNGTDDYDFSALPGGYRDIDSYYKVGYVGIWWGASEGSSDDVYFRGMRNSRFSRLFTGGFGRSFLFSVRCLQD